MTWPPPLALVSNRGYAPEHSPSTPFVYPPSVYFHAGRPPPEYRAAVAATRLAGAAPRTP